MFPFDVPEGTSLVSLIRDVIPEAHARLVPPSAGREPFRTAIELDGLGRWVVELDGATMKVRDGEERAPDARLRARADDARVFFEHWMRSAHALPKPSGEVLLLTDPRMLKRAKMVSGAIELAIRDFVSADGDRPRRIALAIHVGAPAKKIDPDPDVVVETSLRAFRRLVVGEVGPEEALADGDVVLKGKRLVAMQFAYAATPLFPRR